ncbi:MAG: gluconate 2-dehydrogenase subunit 3 family protein [Gammaproteobacteria bacterium]
MTRQPDPSASSHAMLLPRRSFLKSTGGLLTGAFIAAHWTQICDAAEHAHSSATEPAPHAPFLTAAEKAEAGAIASCIIPSGATPGAREANAIQFIDTALATFMARLVPEWRAGMAEFAAAFRKSTPGVASFASASAAQQVAFMHTVDRTTFFNTMRTLTVLGTLTSPSYGGNRDKAGWKLMGFVDLHIFTPPFGDYDRDYKGFVPYPKGSKS